MFKVLASIAILSTSINSECIGGKFFKGSSKRFLPGLEKVCFGMTDVQLSAIVPKSAIIDSVNRFNEPKYTYPQSTWYDSKNFQNWFNDGGVCCFGNLYYKNWALSSSYKDIGFAISSDFGISTLYVGNRDRQDTGIAFTIYSGPSKKYVRKIDRKYEKYASVNGLFDITINVDHYLSRYFEYLLDSVGYSRPCAPTRNINCLITETTDVSIVATDDYPVIVLFDKHGRKVHIRLRSDMYSLVDAMQDNIRMKYEKHLTKFQKLDE
jgi:hypothetical protein